MCSLFLLDVIKNILVLCDKIFFLFLVCSPTHANIIVLETCFIILKFQYEYTLAKYKYTEINVILVSPKRYINIQSGQK